MPKYRTTIAYDGTHYNGWQIQPNGVAIQALLQQAAHTILREEVGFTGSGRTDTGVHALGQIAHFDTFEQIDLSQLLRSLNGLLPPDIRVHKIEEADSDFHARYSATGKIYHYHLCTEAVYNPFQRLYSLHLPQGFDLDQVKRAIPHLIGTHDFTSLANLRGEGLEPESRVRTLRRITLTPTEGGLILEFEGDGFLYKMVRNIVGLLLEISAGKRSSDEIPALLEAKDRRLSAATAPPHGLFLAQVQYG